MEHSRKKLIFRECTNFALKARPGYASPDSILGADEIPQDGTSRRIRIETNTTASVMEIVTNHVEFVDDK
jgi:hypothetical protein